MGRERELDTTSRRRLKSGAYLTQPKGSKIQKQAYWRAKLALVIEKKIDFFLNTRISPEIAKRFLELFENSESTSPSNLMKNLILDNFKIQAKNNSKVQILMELWKCTTLTQLMNILIDDAYKNFQIRFLALKDIEEKKNLGKERKKEP